MTEPPASRALAGTTTVLLTLLGWSSVPLFLKHFAESIDPWTSNGWRYGFSALLWAPVLVAAQARRALPAGLWRAAMVPSAFNAVGQVAFCYAHYRIDPGLIAFGLRSHVIFVAAGAFALFPAERAVIRSPVYLAGLLAVVGGTSGAVLLGERALEGAQAQGVLLAVASGLLFAGYALAVRRSMGRYNSVIAFAAISQYTAGAMVALMFVLGEGGGAGPVGLPRGELVLLLLSAVIGIALGHVLYYMSIGRLGVAISSGVLQLHPFVVAVASLYLFGEVLMPGQWAGGAVALAGAVLMLSVQGRLQRPAEKGDSPL